MYETLTSNILYDETIVPPGPAMLLFHSNVARKTVASLLYI